MPVFLDTNVFLYAAGAEHPLREACHRVLMRVASGELGAVTSSEVVQELLYVVSRRGYREQAVSLARNVLSLFPDLLAVGRAEMLGACELLERYPGLLPRGAVHAATMAQHALIELVSADAHFDIVEGLRRIPPDQA